MRSPRRRGGRIAVLCVAAGLLGTPAAGAGPSPVLDRVYERRLMSAADARCRLFAPDVAKALEAAALQARGAALRAGAAPAAVRGAEERAAARAAEVSCQDGDLQRAAGRVRDAFKGYADLRRLSFPGTDGAWDADRRPQKDPARPGELLWRLVERGRGPDGVIAAGLGVGDDLIVVAPPPPGGRAASARLILRDPLKSPEPFFDPREPGLKGRIPPAWLTTAFLAKEIAPLPRAAPAPGAASAAPALVVAFPPSAAAAVRGLDPRESVRVDLVEETRTGERLRTVWFEVGDFAAASAFLAAGRRR